MAGFPLCNIILFVTIFNNILSDTNVSATQGTETHISRKITLLREQMRLHNVSAYIITDGDEHQTDYIVAERDRRRAWISGFSGLQGDAVVTMNKTALWTLKSLWFLARKEIPNDWLLMESCPGLTTKYIPIEAWLLNELEPGSRVGADPNVAYTQWNEWEQKLRWKNISLVPLEKNLIDLIWKDQPGFRKDQLYDLPPKITGRTQEEKLKLIREDMAELKTDLYVVSALDEIAWITNMRGTDIPYVPVFRSHMLIGKDFAKVYLPPEKPSPKVLRILNLANIAVFDYDQFWMDLKAYSEQANAILLPKSYNSALGVSYKIFDTIPREKVRSKVSPILLRKDKKNSAEIAGMKQAHLREGMAMAQWMMKMEKDMESNTTIRESDAIERLREIRFKQQFSRGESCECVAGYGPNSANFFFIPKNKSTIEIGKDKPFMITTGGQYDDGTTRTARTLHYGKPTDHQKTAYTALLAGIIDLVKLIFPSGTSACTTDIVVQMPLYRIGQEYEYETVQGIGASLSVYEAFNDTYDLNVFRIQGIGYRQGREWGMLLENVVTVVPANTTFKPEKQFMTFKMITLLPYERNLINPNQLTNEQLEWLNKYHEEVRSKVGAELSRQGDETTRKWLNAKTESIKRMDYDKNQDKSEGKQLARKMSINADKGDNLEQIYAWLDDIPFSRPKKNTARDFSDAVLMAELLKKYYPRLVDLHNYNPGNSVAKKLDNWCTLNRKILSKIDIKLKKDTIEKLANSQPGVIEKVLTDLRAKILKDFETDTERLYNVSEDKGKGESTRNAINPEMVANKTVPREIFMKLKQELQEKKDTINVLCEKVLHLESMLKLKDQRIKDLTTQIPDPADMKPKSSVVGTQLVPIPQKSNV